MAQCKWCDRSGWFLSVTSQGVCKNCAPVIAIDAESRARVLKESAEIIRSSKKPETRLSRCDLIIKYASALERYERRGITVLETPPSTIISRFKNVREQILAEAAQSTADAARAKASVASTVKSKVGILSKALLAIREYAAKSERPDGLAQIEGAISRETHLAQLLGYLDEAKKAEFKGQKKKALDQYYEALYLLRHDDVDDSLQRDQIGVIEAKIFEFGGKLG